MTIPVLIKLRERGPVRRGLKRAHRQASKIAWKQSAEWFVVSFADRRFTHAHARRAGYTPRKRAYEARKLKAKGHTYPLQFSGTARIRASNNNTVATANGARVRYPGLQGFNRRHPNSQIDMRKEWETVLEDENVRVAEKYDSVYSREMNPNNQGQLFEQTFG